jgi:type VI secretion system ImpC/EvpB family protein
MPLVHKKNSDFAAFIGAQSLHKPAEYDDPDATANANLAARLPYLFATCRFAHYLKCIVRDKIGSFKERADMQRWLNDWIMNYVDGDPSISSEETKAASAGGAEVVVEEVEGNPGYYTSKFFLRPHYQLEGLTAPGQAAFGQGRRLSPELAPLVSKRLPSQGGPPRFSTGGRDEGRLFLPHRGQAVRGRG